MPAAGRGGHRVLYALGVLLPVALAVQGPAQ